MSDTPTKTYPPSFLHATIADHEAERAGATPEESSAIETKGDAMSDIRRYTVCCHLASEKSHDGPHQYLVQGDSGPYVLWEDHHAEVERLKADVERLTALVGIQHHITNGADACPRCDELHWAAVAMVAEVRRLMLALHAAEIKLEQFGSTKGGRDE